MNLRASVLTLTLAMLAAPTIAHSSEIDDLKHQIEALTQRVEALEKQLGKVEETQTAIAAETLEPTDPWQRLGIGLKYDEVEELLGKPVSKKKGSVEMWYYSDAKKEGPFVKFIFKQVHSWKAPAEQPAE